MSVLGIGAVALGLGLAGSADSPDPIKIQYAEPTEQEKEISRKQLEIARALKDRVDNPSIAEEIYRNLPEMNMSNRDRAAFTSEFTRIKQDVVKAGMTIANQAYGQNIDSMVERGAMSPEHAARVKAENSAAVGAMAKIYNKKIDAARYGMARNAFIGKGKQGLATSSAIAQVDSVNKNLYQSTISQGLKYHQKERAAKAGFGLDVAGQNFRNDLSTQQLKTQFGTGLLDVGTRLIGDYKADQAIEELTKLKR